MRDPNSVGQDVVYDAHGRAGLATDTANHTTNSTYDKAGNRIAAIDGKNQTTSYKFDARGRQKSQTDRISGVTSFTYLATGQLALLTDAESQTTSYTYDDAGDKLTEQYPDHTAGSGVGTSGYGIVTFTLIQPDESPASRIKRATPVPSITTWPVDFPTASIARRPTARREQSPIPISSHTTKLAEC